MSLSRAISNNVRVGGGSRPKRLMNCTCSSLKSVSDSALAMRLYCTSRI